MNWKHLLLAASVAACSNQAVEICDDAIDNDFDGLVDCADNNCSALRSCVGVEDCVSPGDEDGNGQSDCEDEACQAHPACNPESACADGQDNDLDGLPDCSDEDCFDAPSCTGESCGDGVATAEEQCDDGNTTNGDGCDSSCQFEFICGDNIQLFPNEECDDGNLNDGDGCNSSCHLEFCGDGIINLNIANGEFDACDDGNSNDGDGCSSLCQIESATCGDAIVGPNEECDDGNLSNGDGCDSNCALEGEFFLESEPNEDGSPSADGDAFNGNDFDSNGVAIQNALNQGIILLSDGAAKISGAISPIGDEDVFAISNAGPAAIEILAETFSDPLFTVCEGIDTALNLRNGFSGIVAFDDDSGVDLCSQVSGFSLAPGEVIFVQVLSFGDGDLIPQYFLQVRFQ